MIMFFQRRTIYSLLFTSFIAISSSAQANLERSQNQVAQTHRADQKLQQQINQLDQKTRQTLADYQRTQRQADLIEAYNQQLNRMIQSQRKEQSQLNNQLSSLNETEQVALPQVVTLYKNLQRFVTHDIPFLPQERAQRLKRLQAMLDRADVSLAEKYRQVLDAYKVEINYSHSIGNYEGVLSQPSKNDKQVTYFRLGRLALYYQTFDGKHGGLWEPANHQWQALNEEQNHQLSIAIAMAKKQHIPQLLYLPMPQDIHS